MHCADNMIRIGNTPVTVSSKRDENTNSLPIMNDWTGSNTAANKSECNYAYTSSSTNMYNKTEWNMHGRTYLRLLNS